MSFEKILLTRHAQSLEDVDPSLHNLADDRLVGLTDLGVAQTLGLVERLRLDPVTRKRAVAYVSPSYWAQATWGILGAAFPGLLRSTTVECMRNLDWGDITPGNKAEVEAARYAAGVLSFTFPGGDHTPDYSAAIGRFIGEALVGSDAADYPECIVALTHGFALRLLARATAHRGRRVPLPGQPEELLLRGNLGRARTPVRSAFSAQDAVAGR